MNLKELIAKSNLSPVQLAKSIKSLKTITESHAEFEAIKKEFVPDKRMDRITQIITGLEQEDEFAILCRLMGTCQSLVGIDQTPVISNDKEIPPDFLATFSPGCSVIGKSKADIGLEYKCFIEVKSSQKTSYKISKNDFDQRINFAKRYNIPLLFAVRFWATSDAALWVIVESDYLETNNRKLDISALLKGVRHLLLDDYFLMPIPNLHVAHYYDSKTKESGVKHFMYGSQVKTVLLFQDFQYELPEKDQLFFSALFDSYRLKEVQIKKFDNITVQVLKVGVQSRSLCDLLYAINRLAVDEHGDRLYDPSRLSSRFDSHINTPTFITREMIEYYTALRINSKPLFVKLAFEEPSEQFKKLNKLCSVISA
jgi:hypothetical protein